MRLRRERLAARRSQRRHERGRQRVGHVEPQQMPIGGLLAHKMLTRGDKSARQRISGRQNAIEFRRRRARLRVADSASPAQYRRAALPQHLFGQRRQAAVAVACAGVAAGKEHQRRAAQTQRVRDLRPACVAAFADVAFGLETRPVLRQAGVAGEMKHVEFPCRIGLQDVRQFREIAAVLDRQQKRLLLRGRDDAVLFLLEIERRRDVFRRGCHEQQAQRAIRGRRVGNAQSAELAVRRQPPHRQNRGGLAFHQKLPPVVQRLPRKMPQPLIGVDRQNQRVGGLPEFGQFAREPAIRAV